MLLEEFLKPLKLTHLEAAERMGISRRGCYPWHEWCFDERWMKLQHVSTTVAIALALAAPAYSQNTPAPSSPPSAKEKSLISKASGVFGGPLHPVVKGVASSGGVGLGVGYDFPARGRWETSAEAILTVPRYWSAQFDTAYRGGRASFEGYARLRQMSQLSFFGPGTESSLADRTSFLLREPVVGALVSLRTAPWMSVGGRVEELWTEVGRGRSPTFASIETRFEESVAPGLIEQPRFGRYQGFIELQAPAAAGQAFNQGGRYRAAYGLYSDQQFDRFTFRRLDLEARHKFTVFGPHRRLTLHGWVATTDASAGHDVPFFLQPTLGHNSQVRSVNEDLLGTDGSQAALRGFDNFRFRDRQLLLLQAEYRVPVWGPLDATVFVDAGKVARRARDLNFSGLRRNYGVSLSMMRGSSTLARTDVAFGGGEGLKVLVSFGVGSDD